MMLKIICLVAKCSRQRFGVFFRHYDIGHEKYHNRVLAMVWWWGRRIVVVVCPTPFRHCFSQLVKSVSLSQWQRSWRANTKKGRFSSLLLSTSFCLQAENFLFVEKKKQYQWRWNDGNYRSVVRHFPSSCRFSCFLSFDQPGYWSRSRSRPFPKMLVIFFHTDEKICNFSAREIRCLSERETHLFYSIRNWWKSRHELSRLKCFFTFSSYSHLTRAKHSSFPPSQQQRGDARLKMAINFGRSALRTFSPLLTLCAGLAGFIVGLRGVEEAEWGENLSKTKRRLLYVLQQ